MAAVQQAAQFSENIRRRGSSPNSFPHMWILSRGGLFAKANSCGPAIDQEITAGVTRDSQGLRGGVLCMLCVP